MKNCFDGYLTEACKYCEFWKNNVHEIGCGYPGPIDHCEAFSKESISESSLRKLNNKRGHK